MLINHNLLEMRANYTPNNFWISIFTLNCSIFLKRIKTLKIDRKRAKIFSIIKILRTRYQFQEFGKYDK